ncbi:MAG: 8-oxo-dGTP diphosphatase [Eubacterium sp.]|nr:8-oxo-dGTP diphosphatase [Eubacterium sp.]
MSRLPELTTLCYIEKDGKYLMLHRIKKEKDINKDKYIGVGGHFEYGESPDDCLKREVMEETGLKLLSYKPRGIVTFIYGKEDRPEDRVVEYMHLYTASEFEGQLIECDEGQLEWIDKSAVYDLPLWEGDKIFFRLLEEREDYFSLKLIYSEAGQLIFHEII